MKNFPLFSFRVTLCLAFVLFFSLPKSVKADGGLEDLFGPIDPSYQYPLESLAFHPDEYSVHDWPVEDFRSQTEEEADTYFQGVWGGNSERFSLYQEDCHRAHFAEALSVHRRQGYRLSQVEVTHHEGGFKNWRGSYFRIIQKVRLTLRDVQGRNRPLVFETSCCKMRFWRW